MKPKHVRPAQWSIFILHTWPYYQQLAGLAFVIGVALFIYGGVVGSTIWMFAPLLGLIFTPLSCLARTIGWAILFTLLVLTFPLALALQGIG